MNERGEPGVSFPSRHGEFGFTTAERRILVFLALVFFVGGAVSLFGGRKLAPEVSTTPIEDDAPPYAAFGETYPAETMLARLHSQSGVLPPVRTVDVNTACRIELETLPGIGQVKATAIVSYRERFGPFGSPDDLQRVSGIGPKTVERLKPYIVCSEPDGTR
jgi:competence ComEA-like helix-hairpin-helix protein